MIRQDRNWKPFRFSKTIAKGSPLDFSASLDAPAGKYGFVRSSANGEFVFENAPEKKIRFFGTNVCMGANFPDKRPRMNWLTVWLCKDTILSAFIITTTG